MLSLQALRFSLDIEYSVQSGPLSFYSCRRRRFPLRYGSCGRDLYLDSAKWFLCARLRHSLDSIRFFPFLRLLSDRHHISKQLNPLDWARGWTCPATNSLLCHRRWPDRPLTPSELSTELTLKLQSFVRHSRHPAAVRINTVQASCKLPSSLAFKLLFNCWKPSRLHCTLRLASSRLDVCCLKTPLLPSLSRLPRSIAHCLKHEISVKNSYNKNLPIERKFTLTTN